MAEPHPPAPRRRTTTWLALVALAGAATAAVGTWILTRPGPTWTAVAPLSDATYAPGRPVGLGVVLVVVGALAVGGAVGFAVARARVGGAS